MSNIDINDLPIGGGDIDFEWEQKDLDALVECIEEKWKPLESKVINWLDEPSCALCILNNSECWKCIIFKDTGESTCEGIPYEQWSEACETRDEEQTFEYASEVLDYLEDLKERMEDSLL